MTGIQQDNPLAWHLEGITVITGMLPDGKLGHNTFQLHLVIARLCLLVVMGKSQGPDLVQARGYKEISQVRASGTGKVGMAEP